MSDYDVLRFSEFNNHYEDVLKDYSNSFQSDFSDIRKTIVGKLEDYDIQPKQVTGETSRIQMGENFRFKALKTRVMIKEAQSKIGRLIWICDEDKKNIFLTDVYHKNDREDHNEARIAQAHNEYYDEFYE